MRDWVCVLSQELDLYVQMELSVCIYVVVWPCKVGLLLCLRVCIIGFTSMCV